MNKLRMKLKSCRGFSLAEMLIVVLILLMVTSVVAGGMPVAATALDKVVETSNAQLLISTTMIALREELSTARDIVAKAEEGSEEKTTIEYTNSLGLKSKISLGADGKTIMLTQYNSSGASVELPLVSNEAASKSRKDGQPVLYTSYTSVSFDTDKGIVTIKDLSVKRKSGNQVAAGVGNYSIRVVGYTKNP